MPKAKDWASRPKILAIGQDQGLTSLVLGLINKCRFFAVFVNVLLPCVTLGLHVSITAVETNRGSM